MWGQRVIPTSWPYSQDTYEAFTAIKRAGFTSYCCGDRHAPHVLIAAYDWGSYIDVINIRGADRVTAARLPAYDGLNIFAPCQAVWHHMGTLESSVTAMLRLPPPSHPNAPTITYPAPVTLFVASHEQQPMTVKPGKQT
jgi:hypothetical protein